MTIELSNEGIVSDTSAKQRELAIEAFEEYKNATSAVWKNELEILKQRAEEIRVQFREIKERITDLESKTNPDTDGMGFALQIAEMIPGATKALLLSILEKKFGEIPKKSAPTNGKQEPSQATHCDAESDPPIPFITDAMSKETIVKAIAAYGRPITTRELVEAHQYPWSKPKIHLMINELAEEGRIEKLGEKHNRTYGLLG